MSTTISGTVSLGQDPAPNAVVELHNATGDIVDQSQVDEAGRYIFHVKGGRWTLNCWDNQGHRGKAELELADGDHEVVDLALR